MSDKEANVVQAANWTIKSQAEHRRIATMDSAKTMIESAGWLDAMLQSEVSRTEKISIDEKKNIQ